MRQASTNRFFLFGLVSTVLLLMVSAQAQELGLVSTVPAPHQVNVARSTEITLNFNQPVSSGSLNQETLLVFSEKSGNMGKSLRFSPDKRTAVVTPNRSFIVGDRVTVILAKQPQHPETFFQNGYIWEFYVAPEQGGMNFQALEYQSSLLLTSVVAADLDGDGVADLAMTGRKGDADLLKLAYFRGGQVVWGDSLILPARVRPLYTGDLNRDGYPDFVLVHRGRTKYAVSPLITICFLSAEGKVSLSQNLSLAGLAPGNTEPRAAVINDFNGDGHLDIGVMLLNELNQNAAAVFLNDGTGRFPDTPNTAFDRSRAAESMFAVDINNSGFIDIGIGHTGTSALINTFLNSGEAAFSQSLPAMRVDSADLEIAYSVDLTGDRLVDVFAADYREGRLLVSRLESIGSINQVPSPIFNTEPREYRIVEHPNSADYGDLDADGQMDIVITGSNNRDLWIMWNQSGEFDQSQIVNIPEHPARMVIGDMNNDYALDVVIADTTGLITILYNNTGNFEAPFAPTLLSPADGSFTQNHQPLFQWQNPGDVNENDSLFFRITIRSSEKTRIYDSMTDPAGFAPPQPVPQGQGVITFSPPDTLGDALYQWSVEAFDGALWSAPSSARRLTVDSTPPTDLQLAFPNADFDNRWFAVTANSTVTAQVTFTEAHPDSAVLAAFGLGGPFVFTELTGGEGVTADLTFLPAPSADGEFPVTVTLIDSAGLSAAVSGIVGIDRNPPTGAAARVDGDVSATRQFRVSWGGGNDGSGSGLSGEYRVQYRQNDGPWTLWLERTTATEAQFDGSHHSRYDFEAAAYDRVGFLEPFADTAEASIWVNVYENDHTPPAAPLDVLANGANPSPWQASPDFTIRWSLPFDESGIRSSFWKLGAAPTADNDYDEQGAPTGPASVSLAEDGVVRFYVWLADSAGNADYRNHATVDLRRDSAPPVIHTMTVDAPTPNAVVNEVPWFNSQTLTTYQVSASYSEPNPQSAVLTTDGLSDSLVNRGGALGSGDPRTTAFNLTVQNPADRVYTLKTTVTDSAANKAAKSIKIGLDGTPPSGSLASTPAISATDTFTVSWSVGGDGAGSGVARYDIYYKTTADWQLWHSAELPGRRTFTGQNGVTYFFESRAVDFVGLIEPQSADGETGVRVDFAVGDKDAPPPPIDLRANGGTPASPWTTDPQFTITWQKPQDVSGVVGSFWKLGAPPVSNTDTSGVGGKGPAEGPMTVRMSAVGKQWLYVWLIDANGNVDYRNSAQVLLRFDDQPPKISATQFLNPAYGSDWYNPKIETAVNFQITYQEPYPDSLSVSSERLGFYFKTTELQAGIGVKKTVPFSIAGKADGPAVLSVALTDSARNNATALDTIRIDSTPSTGATASSPAVSGQATFAVNWTPGTDDGVGIADLYDVWVKRGDEPWAIWLKDYNGRSADFTGEDTQRYSFEVLSRDLLGNKEVQNFQAESTTLVDFISADSTAPPPPINLRAGDANPSPWQNHRTFTVTWTNPNDPSGIALALFKLGEKPAGNADTSGTIKGGSPASIRATQQNGQMLHLWLKDGAGNADYRNIASVLLRYDAVTPAIDSLVFADPRPAADGEWYNPRVPPQRATLKVYARDANLARLRMQPSSLFEPKDVPPSPGAPAAAFTLSFPNFADASVDLAVTVLDSAGNSTQAVKRLSLDGTPPQNTVAQSPDTVAPGPFTVSWDINKVIETGSGLSGVFSIRVKIDDQPWAVWNSQYVGTSMTYTGEAGKRCAFEVAAYDRVGNWEGFSGVEESVTRVRSSFIDNTPPPAPTDVTVNGFARCPWSSSAEFSINWTQPTDPSGIAQVFYKFFEPPTGAQDFSGSAAGTPPLKVQAPVQGIVPIFMWLKDGAGNVDHRNWAATLLRYDADRPSINQVLLVNAQHANRWFNPDSVDDAHIRLTYSENNPDSIRIYLGSFTTAPIVLDALPAGIDQRIETLIPLSDVYEGCHPLYVVFADSAGNVSSDTLGLCLDATPPTGATAASPPSSTTGRFTVSWADENAGSDGDGSGLSGEYDLKMSINDGPWFDVLNRVKATSYTYVGTQGNTFSFEAAAWDNVGNREAFRGVAETTTLVDTLFVDQTAPAAPIAPVVRGKNPSDWQNTPEFIVEWQNPTDPSGIVAAFFKLGAPPTSAQDFSDSVAVDQNIGKATVRVEQEGESRLHLWLKDGRGNADHANSATIRLRYDATPPTIGMPTTFGHTLLPGWFNQQLTPEIGFALSFDELHPDTLRAVSEALGELRFKPAINAADSITFALNFKDVDDGAHQFYIALKDSAGNWSDEDSVYVFLDSKPPAVTHTPGDSIVEQFSPLTVRVTVADDNPLSSVNLLYWQGGKRTKTTMPMAASGSTYTAEIPATEVSDRGVEFMVIATDGVNQTRYPDDSRVTSLGARVRVNGSDNRGLLMPQPLPAGSEENAYRMVSVPLEINQSAPKDVLEDDFGPYDAKVWRLFWWDPSQALYREYADVAALRPGVAYWMITSKEGVDIDTGPGVTVNTVKPFIYILKKGWNDLATPFNFPVDWRDIITASAIDTQMVQGPHAYIGRWQYPFENTVMQPWQGYSVYSELDDFTLTIPDLEATASLAKKAPFVARPGMEWVMQIIARSGDAEDSANYFGCAKTANEKWDYGLDYVEAPDVGSYVSLYFPHADWQLEADRYTTDFRPSKRGNVWEFHVVANRPDGEVRLVFNPLIRLPKLLSLKLVDVDARIAVDVLADSSYTFRFSTDEQVRRFSIYAGDEQFMEEHQDELPEQPSQFELVQNYPNPFNSSTVISYELKEKTEVNLAVYNLLAQRVKQLHAGSMEAGFYQLTWNALDDEGRELGTGVYILRLETPNFTSTRKMVYIR